MIFETNDLIIRPSEWEDIDDFYKFTPSSVKLENYIYNEFKHKIPVAI